MKKKLWLIICIGFAICESCKSDIDTIPASEMNRPVEAAVDTSKGYQPVTANSFIKYVVTTNGAVTDSLINTVLGTNSIINKKLYYAVSQRSVSTGSTYVNFMSNINHSYSVRDITSVKGLATDILYLIDNVPVGYAWTAQFTDNGTLSGDPAQIIGTIVEKNIKKNIASKVFSNVIHNTIQLQHDVGSGFTTYGTYDFYVANGIGIIELDAVLGFSGVPTIKTTEVLADYSIK